MERGRVLAAYTAAWAQESADSIRRELADCWTESSIYVSPLTDVVRGVSGLTNLILDLPVMFPGASLGPTRGPDVHHDAACMPWRLRSTHPIRTLGRDFGHSLDGVDFVEFDEEGRIRRITAFFGLRTPPEDGTATDQATARRPSRLVDLDGEDVQDPHRNGRPQPQRQPQPLS